MFRFVNATRRLSFTRLQVVQVNRCHTQSQPQDVLQHEQPKTNAPIMMENPYVKDKPLCILCKYRITPDYKNFRLLSQFVSRFTGKIYGRHITGLCEKQQKRVEREIQKARWSGFMGYYYRDPKFAHDPELFNPDRPFRPHRF